MAENICANFPEKKYLEYRSQILTKIKYQIPCLLTIIFKTPPCNSLFDLALALHVVGTAHCHLTSTSYFQCLCKQQSV